MNGWWKEQAKKWQRFNPDGCPFHTPPPSVRLPDPSVCRCFNCGQVGHHTHTCKNKRIPIQDASERISNLGAQLNAISTKLDEVKEGDA